MKLRFALRWDRLKSPLRPTFLDHAGPRVLIQIAVADLFCLQLLLGAFRSQICGTTRDRLTIAPPLAFEVEDDALWHFLLPETVK